MTKDEKNDLAFKVRLSHGYCHDQSQVLREWLEANSHVNIKEARSFISMCQGVPFPSIRGKKEGPFPVYKDRPYYDARVHEGIE